MEKIDTWFRTLVASDGYEFALRCPIDESGAIAEPDEFLVPKSDKRRELVRLKGDLYRTITEDLGPESILRLAAAHGPLGKVHNTLPATRVQGARTPTAPAELASNWQRLADLQRVVRLFDLVQSGDRSELERVIKRNKSGGVRLEISKLDSHGRRKSLSGEQIAGPGAFDPDDVIGPARMYVRQQINRHIAEVSPQVLVYFETSESKMSLMPRTLEAALWLQFAESFLRNKPRKQCEQCKAWFEPLRHDQKFCGATCRVRNFRSNEEQA
jgi:hypothetical protein